MTIYVSIWGIRCNAGKHFHLPECDGLHVLSTNSAWVKPLSSSISQAQGISFEAAYGKMLGTTALCAITPCLISLVPGKIIKRVFPPVVPGATLILIGASLITGAMKNWGGGSACANGGLCNGNGNVHLPFANAEYMGLGFFVFVCIVTLETFGSPFMRNGALLLSLLCGYLLAAVVPSISTGQSFVSFESIKQAPVATFLWTTTYNLGLYIPGILPMITVFITTSIECIGDTSATLEISQMPAQGSDFIDRTKGALMNDGLSSIFSSLAGSLPPTTYAKNNGVLALSNVTSRQAGWACAFWTLVMGVFAKFGGWVLSIPNCVLGGAFAFLFATVIASGIKVSIPASLLSLHTDDFRPATI